MKVRVKVKRKPSIHFLVAISLFAFLSVFVAFTCNSAFSVEIFKSGATYPVLEKDAYEEILERVRSKNVEGKFSEIKKSLTQKLVANVKGLKKSVEREVRTVTPFYRLPFSIRDDKGNVIYPEGYSFNPLDYVRFPYTIVFFDATSAREINWLKSSSYTGRWDVIFVITKGNVYDAELLIGRTVYAADEKIVEYFSIKRVPSVVYQDGNRFVVFEPGIYGRVENTQN